MGYVLEKVIYIYLVFFDNKMFSNVNKKVIVVVRFKKEEEE